MARFGKEIITLWPAPVRDEPGEIPGLFLLTDVKPDNQGLSRFFNLKLTHITQLGIPNCTIPLGQ
jgi:hypothetical protein